MTTQYVTNFPIPAVANIFQLIWKSTRAMKAAGWTTMASSDGAAKDTSGVAANDKWGGSGSPLADVYVTNTGSLTDATSGGWIVMRGPSTIKMPLNAAPTGTLVRGETITQATSGAEGELIGYVWDTGTASGWAVIAPHTGTFDMTHTVTGSSSAATFVPLAAGTLVTFVREMVIARDTTSVANAKINGNIWYICADDVAEAAQLPSALALSAGCTATVPPGFGGTANAWPAKALLLRGGSTSTYTGWLSSSTGSYVATNNGQIFAANATPGAGVSADGSFYAIASNSAAANVCCGFIFTRVDDTEPGDCDPYVFFSNTGSVVNNWANTASAAAGAQTTFVAPNAIASNLFMGYAARGCPVTARDLPAAWIGTMTFYGGQGSPNYIVWAAGNTVGLTLLNHPSASPPIVREPVALWQNGNGGIAGSSRSFKGRCRWFQFTASIGTTYDTWDSKQWLQLATTAVQSGAPLVPYDGTTTPTL